MGLVTPHTRRSQYEQWACDTAARGGVYPAARDAASAAATSPGKGYCDRVAMVTPANWPGGTHALPWSTLGGPPAASTIQLGDSASSKATIQAAAPVCGYTQPLGVSDINAVNLERGGMQK